MDKQTLDRIGRAAAEAFEDTPIFLAYAYGSRVYGTPDRDSDLDVGYYLSPSYDRRDLPMLDQMLLEDGLSNAIGVSVDLRNLAEAPLELRGRALVEGVRVYCCMERQRVALETSLLARYHDYKPTLDAMHGERLAAFATRKAW